MTSNGVKYFDAHTHANFAAYGEDRDAVIERARGASVAMNVVGTQFDTSRSAVELAKKYDDVYATIGLHPIHTAKSYHDEKEIGEGTKEVQMRAFIEQIELAGEIKKPLMLHIRNAYTDALDVLRAHAGVRGDVHFFAGDWEVAKKFLELGFTLSFTGVITFARDYDEVIRSTPLDMLLSETDAPYVTPVPYRGKRNEPSYVPLVVQKIAEIRGEDTERVAAALMENARRVFGIV